LEAEALEEQHQMLMHQMEAQVLLRQLVHLEEVVEDMVIIPLMLMDHQEDLVVDQEILAELADLEMQEHILLRKEIPEEMVTFILADPSAARVVEVLEERELMLLLTESDPLLVVMDCRHFLEILGFLLLMELQGPHQDDGLLEGEHQLLLVIQELVVLVAAELVYILVLAVMGQQILAVEEEQVLRLDPVAPVSSSSAT
jgi:hypothetical protein